MGRLLKKLGPEALHILVYDTWNSWGVKTLKDGCWMMVVADCSARFSLFLSCLLPISYCFLSFHMLMCLSPLSMTSVAMFCNSFSLLFTLCLALSAQSFRIETSSVGMPPRHVDEKRRGAQGWAPLAFGSEWPITWIITWDPSTGLGHLLFSTKVQATFRCSKRWRFPWMGGS